MDIIIKVIDDKQHREGISGADWYFDADGNCQVRVSRMSDWRRETILAFHEAVEAVLCKYNGVTVEQVDIFDSPFELAHDNVTNVGDKTDAPYRREHCFATAVERILAGELEVPWQDYDDELAAFPIKPEGQAGNGGI